ncbi:MAG: hypothetical protein E6R05_03045 [Candidatus Moraniibacteriota bacterium]|nr:MAG: hypothetical protein E6R05_03045 [Candidatus Moranbacteria bacterium]
MLYFFLGNTPDLSLLELESVTGSTYTRLTPFIAYGDLDESKLPIVHNLGGLRKIAIGTKNGHKNDVSDLLSEVLSTIPNKNVAITDYADCGLTKSDIHALKSSVTRPIRFVSMETKEHELLMLAHQNVAELNILPDPSSSGNVVIACTSWIFDAEDWVRRDRNKPYRDIKRGMLPPKVARIMANLALCGVSGKTLYDPFCGTGTVLSEGALLGAARVLGSDTNNTAIEGSKLNLDWTCSTYSLNTTADVAQADATHPPFSDVDCIATEPYMGPLLDDRNPLPLDKIKDIAKGLDKLYRGAFKAWHKILPSGGRVVMTIPSFAVYGRVIPTISVDTVVSLGYNYISTVPYGKPGATVIRNITVLEKK